MVAIGPLYLSTMSKFERVILGATVIVVPLSGALNLFVGLSMDVEGNSDKQFLQVARIVIGVGLVAVGLYIFFLVKRARKERDKTPE